MKNNSTPKRLVIEVDAKTHSLIKVHTAKRCLSIKDWIMKAIVEYMRQEKEFEAHD